MMDDGPLPRPHLSPRQVTILTMLSDGMTQANIAEELQISRHTVRSYIYIAFQKLGAHNAAGAVAEFLRLAPWPDQPDAIE